MNALTSTILVVDGFPDHIDQIANTLYDEAQHLVVATNGEEALATALDKHPDLILLDVEMPDMDGFETCRRLKSNPRTEGIPVVFITEQDTVDDELKGIDSGAVDYIRRPYRPEVVRSRMRAHLAAKRERDALLHMVNTDGLTGAASRRHFDDMLKLEWRRAIRDSLSISLVMIDIDHFKAFNDHYGHAQGDDCLRSVAQRMQQVLRRPGDFLARYGGEEFAVILTHMEWRGAQIIARDICRGVADLEIPHEGSKWFRKVTVSAGYATVHTTRDLTADMLVEAADQMLYEAKKLGRNQVRGIQL